jgi:hypothetical protein
VCGRLSLGFLFLFCAALGVKKPKETMNTAKTQTADAGEFIFYLFFYF